MHALHITRRGFLASTSALFAAPLALRSADDAPRDVPWLAEVQMVPMRAAPTPAKLRPLLIERDGKPITTHEAWEKRLEDLRRWWMDFLKPPPRSPEPPEFRVLEEDEMEGVLRQKISYETEPGIGVEAYLIKPLKPLRLCPGVVVLHSTVDHTIRQPAGLAPDVEKAFGLKLAKRGIVTISPRNFLWPREGKIDARTLTEAYFERRPESKGMAKMLHDAQVALDILAKLPEVDPARLGAVGHSLGAKEVLYLAAFDERLKATVSSEGGVGTKFSNWHDIWYLGETVQEPNFEHEHHELLALAAPRPFLLVGGDSADGDQSWPFIEAALPVYRLYGEPARLGLFNHKQGHAVPPVAEERIEQWLTTYLGGDR